MNVEDLVVKHVEWIRRKARSYTYNKDEADDLASDTIFRCLQNASRFDASRDFKPWAKTIMENIFKTQLGIKKRMPIIPVEECYDLSSCRKTDSTASFTRLISLLRRNARHTVNLECVILYAKGYSYSEIAQKVGILSGTVKSRIANGRKFVDLLFENT